MRGAKRWPTRDHNEKKTFHASTKIVLSVIYGTYKTRRGDILLGHSKNVQLDTSLKILIKGHSRIFDIEFYS